MFFIIYIVNIAESIIMFEIKILAQKLDGKDEEIIKLDR